MGRLFGTDGARGIANTEITCELALQIGHAIAMASQEIYFDQRERPRFLIGQDTRASSSMLANALAAGLNAVGTDVLMAGVVPTPAVALLVSKWGLQGGAMVSASHNPCEYNGIKLFGGTGEKLPDALEETIENIILSETCQAPHVIGGGVGRCAPANGALQTYTNHLLASVNPHLAEDLRKQGVLRIALDCANGSACQTQPALFQSMGFDCGTIANNPDGTNINTDCGSTHMQNLRDFVRRNGYAVGFAFDGDADRVLAVDETGALADGDKIVAICAKHMASQGKLRGNTAVVTVMSNMGFHVFCRKNAIRAEVTAVGDRYVLEAMKANGYNLGGEQSGHIIFSDFAQTGDGQLTALQLLEVMRQTGKPLSELASEVPIYPQVLVNITVSNLGKLRCDNDPEIQNAAQRARAELGEDGRVLIRVSGTEPLIRVMLEGQDVAQIARLANELAEIVRERLL
ncbi:MAG: phosphoglucosamine mutase [Oscillospiraceae bacterium]|nr:phosphoglucosamine mutase [Oscillospiraceae bacterium]